jgi:hypothetical protein
LLGRLQDALRENELIEVNYTLLRKLKVLGYLFIREIITHLFNHKFLKHLLKLRVL